MTSSSLEVAVVAVEPLGELLDGTVPRPFSLRTGCPVGHVSMSGKLVAAIQIYSLDKL